MASPESLFYQAASAALSLIKRALSGDASALRKLEPILPKRLRTSIVRQVAETRAKKKLRRR